MKDFLKKNWFVCVVALIFVSIAIFFAYDQNKDKLPGKRANGAGVVFTIDGKDYTADDLYDKYYASNGKSTLVTTITKKIMDAEVETTDEMASNASSYASYYDEQAQSYYGVDYLSLMQYYYNVTGYADTEEYFLYSFKESEFMKKYFKDNAETYWDEFKGLYNPRIVYHCLVKMDETPTEDQLTKFEEAKTAWASGDYTFKQFAEKYSDDTTSAVNGGLIGYVDKDTDNYVAEFTAAALATPAGGYSEWFKSEYGYHIIYVETDASDDCLEEEDCVYSLRAYYENVADIAIWEYMKANNVKFANEELEKAFKEYLNVNEDNIIELSRNTEDENEEASE